MHPVDDIIQAIHQINHSFLTLAQRLLHHDREAGMVQLGLSADAANVISALTPAQLTRFSGASHVICAFDCNDHALLGRLAAPPLSAVSSPALDVVSAAGISG